MLTAVVEAEGSGGSSRTHAAVHVPPPLILARCKQGDSLGGSYSRWRSVQTVVRHTSARKESEERFEKHGIGVPPTPLFLLICVERDVRRHVNACEEAGLYVRMRQHTPACVSMRQHVKRQAYTYACKQTCECMLQLQQSCGQICNSCSRDATDLRMHRPANACKETDA
jgi:hypothetical protein